ncbi:porin family protein [Myroides indicus]|uniref:Outer membrane protein with beta-barrel domain n=1 Tax=Myroides indicus TaxID=1323422 RepID=A0A4V3E8Q1_9FLAO|nr:porin family protein [Myroides indicus]TDS61495.1 outer membrane protein with beta-barrel domain [Myroides indicus]
MKKWLTFLGGFLLCFSEVNAQDSNIQVDQITDSVQALDLKYREDQFYFGISHTMMQNKTKGFHPNSFSLGINAGFLRDFPVNSSRTVAIAPGIGYSYLNLRDNLGLDVNGQYTTLDTYSKNNLSIHFVDFPLEFRWRTSTPESHKFWRIYVGVKASYRFSDRQRTSAEGYTSVIRGDDNLNKWLFGTYISAGFNTWNLYVYYGMNTVYKNQLFEDDSQKLRLLNIGVMFYIL